MSRIILLDSKPLGLFTNPRSNPDAETCRAWMRDLLEQKDRFLVPEIIDYELRRELLRANKSQGIHNLDRLKLSVGYLPLTTAVMLQAAAFWAEARQMRLQTAANLVLDVDMILAAQAATLDPEIWGIPGAEVVIATSNVQHLSRFAPAQEWQEIS